MNKPNYVYSREKKQEARKYFDKRCVALLDSCISTLEDRLKTDIESKEVKEIAGSLEVLIRTVYRVLDIPPAKDLEPDEENPNMAKLKEISNKVGDGI